MTKNTAICIIISNAISAIMVFIYCVLQAPDIAITEAVIGTATSTILFSLTLLHINKLHTIKNTNIKYAVDIRQRIFVFLLCFILYLLLIFIINNIPILQGNNVDGNIKISTLYIKNAIKDFQFSSIVTAVVAGYRAFDTLFENVVIFTACYGFYMIVNLDKKKYFNILKEKDKNSN